MTLVAGAVLLAAVAVLPVAARPGLIASRRRVRRGRRRGGPVAGPVIGLVAVALAPGGRRPLGLLPFHLRVSAAHRPRAARSPAAAPRLDPVPLAVVAFAAVDRLVAPLALPLDGERACSSSSPW